jgi:hypothetical protein
MEGDPMARVNQRLWKIPGQRTKRKAWGFTAQINGKQVRRYKAEWTQDDAEAELAKALLQIEPEKPKGPGITPDRAVDRYLAAKARSGRCPRTSASSGTSRTTSGRTRRSPRSLPAASANTKGTGSRLRGRSVKARVPSSARLLERRSTARWPYCATCFVSHTRSGSYSTRCPG